jgi:hypothetical protein
MASKNRKRYFSAQDFTLLWFLGKFPGATAEAVSLIQERQAGVNTPAGGLPTIKSTTQRLRGLSLFGAVQLFNHPATRTTHYGITQLGFEFLQCFDTGINTYRGIEGISVSRLNHYSKIALVAAQIVSPLNLYGDIFGSEITIGQLVSENEMRAAYAEISNQLAANRAAGTGSQNFAEWRTNHLRAVFGGAKNGEIEYSEIVSTYPELLTVGHVESNKSTLKQPDLVVNLDTARRTETAKTAKNILIEVELTPKKLTEYEKIINTFKNELGTKLVYDRVIYFTENTQVENLLKRADRNIDAGLFDTGKLQVLLILHRDGTPTAPKLHRVGAPPALTSSTRNGILTREIRD